MIEQLPFEWFVLLLRVIFIFLLYFFLYQIARVTTRELVALATAAPTTAPTPAGPRRARLVVLDGGPGLDAGEVFPLGVRATVGRHPDNTVALDDPFVSAAHAELALDQGRWWVRDLGSTNGTFVNDQPVTVTTGIKSGDVVQFGRVKLRFVQ